MESTALGATRQALRAFTTIHDEARRKVAAALSHDMRTPLALIYNGAQLLSIMPSLELARRAATKIESNAARLTDMVGDLLDALAFQGGAKLALKPSDQYVQGGNWNVSFEADAAPVSGHWCRDALLRALENLVNNAVKYGNGHSIEIVARESQGCSMLSVRNTGNPIPEDHKEGLFQYLRREQTCLRSPAGASACPT